MRSFIGVVWIFLCAQMAWAECPTAGKNACLTNCTPSASTPAEQTSLSIAGPADVGCFEWDENANVSTDDSGAIRVRASSALFHFDPDRTAAGASQATAALRRCVGGWPGSCDPNLCHQLVTSAGGDLDGTEGAAQNAAIRVGPGTYCIDITALSAAGEDALIEIHGE